MKSLLKAFSILALFGLITGCDPIEGNLKVETPFKAIAKDFNKCDGDPSPSCDPDDHKFIVAAGDYGVSFDVKSKKKANLVMQIRGHKATVELNIPNGKQIPENGNIQLSANESGQPFDLQAQVKTTTQNSERESRTEFCNIQWQETVCRQVGNPPRTECWNYTHTRPGQRHVEFYYRTTEKALIANISEPGQPQVSAQFQGDRTFHETIYTYDSGCL